MKATDLLKKQHRKVEQLFSKLEKGRVGLEALATELANELAAHMTIEQELFYPAVQRIAPELIAESLEEHAIAELALKRILHTSSKEKETFHARVVCLKELIKHHVEEEEEELFPKVEKKLGEEALSELGKQMKALFEESLEAGYEALLPKSASKASADKRPKRAPSLSAN